MLFFICTFKIMAEESRHDDESDPLFKERIKDLISFIVFSI